LLDREYRAQRGLGSYLDLSDALGPLKVDLGFLSMLGECLRSENVKVRIEVARTLSHYPYYVFQIRPAVNALVEALRDPEIEVREIATNAVRKLDGELFRRM
jgi:hypothetical protein